MSTLRDEIIESQKVRSELLKWKLLIVSALGAAGLGFGGTEAARGAYLVLLLIPLACFYVDLLCRHMSLRIIVIGTFLRIGFSDVETAYERFVAETTHMGPKKLNVFALEEWVLEGSTIVLSLLVMMAGFVLPDIRNPEGQIVVIGNMSVQMNNVIPWIFIGVGLSGWLLTVMARWGFARRVQALGALAKNKGLAQELGAIVARNTLRP